MEGEEEQSIFLPSIYFAQKLSITNTGTSAAPIPPTQSLLFVVTFDVVNEQIQELRAILNPDKLAYLQRQLARRQSTVSHEGGNSMGIIARQLHVKDR